MENLIPMIPVPIHREEDKEKIKFDEIDPKHIDIFVNPALHAFKTTLGKFKESPSKSLLDEIHLILLMDGAQDNYQILELLPSLYPYIKEPEFYHTLCVIFSDISHLNKPIQNSLLNFNIFDYLDFNKDISFNLILSICDCNREATELFKTKYMSEKTADHPIIKKLLKSNI